MRPPNSSAIRVLDLYLCSQLSSDCQSDGLQAGRHTGLHKYSVQRGVNFNVIHCKVLTHRHAIDART